jgi:hypothetical protein
MACTSTSTARVAVTTAGTLKIGSELRKKTPVAAASN